jgi:hypothetical protein
MCSPSRFIPSKARLKHNHNSTANGSGESLMAAILSMVRLGRLPVAVSRERRTLGQGSRMRRSLETPPRMFLAKTTNADGMIEPRFANPAGTS